MNKRIIAAVAIIGLAAFSTAAFDGGFTMKRMPKVGDVRKYKQSAKLDIQGQEFEITMVAAEKIVKVEPSGNYSIEETISDAKLNGQEMPEGAGLGNSTTTYTPKGELVDIKGDKVDANTYRLANLALFIVPDKEVKPGDTWSYDVKEDKKSGVVAAKASYTFVGEDKVGTTDTVKVKYSFKESGSDAASSEGTVWFNRSDFSMVKLNTKWTNAPAPGGQGQISGDVTLTLIS